MKKNVHVVPHTHWDREWYFTTSRSKIYLMNNLKKVLRLLSESNGYDHFILDGQASLLDDYLSWSPEDRNLIKNLVTEGKLIVGPWYTQTDQMVISGESIVRNMLYGMQISKEFGDYMHVAYVPDSFGQSAAMPQIYNEFGLEDTLFWRGVSDDEVTKTEYKWRGEDGSVVNVYQIPAGYYIGGDIPEEEEKIKKYLHEDPFKSVWSRSTTNQVLFPNGFDQAPPRENLVNLIDRMDRDYDEFDFEISTFEKYIKSIKENNPELEEISGELLNGKLMRIHKSIFSSRSDLKKLNTQIQNYLVNTLEPILSISYSLGFDYPSGVVKEIWKLMFENAAHDSIGSCVSDTTNEDIYLRYKKARDLAENLVELKTREIVMHISSKDKLTVTAFNTSVDKKSGVFETILYVPQLEFSIKDVTGKTLRYTIIDFEDQTQYILNQGNVLDSQKDYFKPNSIYKVKIAIELKDVPPLGYKHFHLDLSGDTSFKIEKSTKTEIENEYYKICYSEKSIDIFDKVGNRWYKNQAVIEENGDDGDSFNYSPPKKDWIISSKQFDPRVTVYKSDLMSSIEFQYQMKVPKNLEDRENRNANTIFPINLQMILKSESPFIECKLSVDNREVDSHRVCLLFNSEISSKFSFADQQFGLIRRPVVRQKEMNLWNSNKEMWNEVPISIETCQSFVTLFSSNRGIAVIPKAVREYEIVGEDFDTIRLTVFRTYGYMGKENLVYRPGRASGETVIETPDAQCHKKMDFDLSIIYYQGDINQFSLAKKVNDYLKEVVLYQEAEYLNTRLRFTQFPVETTLPKEWSILKSDSNLVLSLVKKAEERDGLIFRFYNGSYHQEEDLQLQFELPIKVAELVDLKEHKKGELLPDNNKLSLNNIGHAKFITLYVEFLDK